MNDVECRASDSFPGTPVAVIWAGARHEVDVILKRWRDPTGLGYRIRTTDGLTLDLYYDDPNDMWRISIS